MSDDLEGLHACSASGEEKLNAEGELAVARLVMDGGDLSHAATHLGNALAEAPALPEAFEALAELATRAGGAATAAGLFGAEHPYIGAVACRAHLLAAAGHWDEALGTLAAVLRHEPDRPWAQVPWLTSNDLAGLVGPDTVASAIARLMSGGLPDPVPPPLTVTLRPFLDLAGASIVRHPDHQMLLSTASGLARRFGEHDRAVAWAAHAHEVRPGHSSAVMLGYALRAADRPDEALAVWEAELARDPGDLSLYVDVAELYASTGRPLLGLPWLDRALAADPAHPLAGPALHGVRFAADGERRHLLALADHLRDHPDHDYAATVLQRHSSGLPWLSGVTGGREATINVMRQMMEGESTADSPIELTCSAIEAPSAILTLRQIFPLAKVRFQSVPDPDPRLPSGETDTVVWRYEGSVAGAAVPEPSPAASAAVQLCAHPLWPSLPAAYDHAVRLSAISTRDLLGVLVHPPAPRTDDQGRQLAARAPDFWVRAVQVFACLGIAHRDTDTLWEDSERHRVLVGLLRGPEDWVTEAAGLALLAVAWSDPATREDVGRHLARRMLDAATAYRTRPVEVLPSLCHFVIACPWLDSSFTSLAADLLDTVRRGDQDEPDPEEVAARGRQLVDEPDSPQEPGPGAAAAPVPAAIPRQPFRQGLFGRLRRGR